MFIAFEECRVVEARIKISDGFEWVQGPLGRTLRARVLSPGADAWFTTRDLPLAGDGNDGNAGWSRVAAAAGVNGNRIVRLTQVHGAMVHAHIRGAPVPTVRPAADAAATDDPDVALAVQVADCVPLLVADAGGRAVAAVHAGWRGTAAGVVATALETLRVTFGVGPDRLIAALGPAIGPCCYRVGADVVGAFSNAGYDPQAIGRWFVRTDAGLSLDLWAANRDRLLASGVAADRVHVARLCTACHPELFHSYRRDGPATGRLAGVVRLKA
jgi:YfiH family protein